MEYKFSWNLSLDSLTSFGSGIMINNPLELTPEKKVLFFLLILKARAPIGTQKREKKQSQTAPLSLLAS